MVRKRNEIIQLNSSCSNLDANTNLNYVLGEIRRSNNLTGYMFYNTMESSTFTCDRKFLNSWDACPGQAL
jgi:hypothetical protein